MGAGPLFWGGPATEGQEVLLDWDAAVLTLFQRLSFIIFDCILSKGKMGTTSLA